MDPVQSWLDSNEVRRMAESLMAPPPKVDVSTVDAGYGENFEGFADTSHTETTDAARMPTPTHQSDGRPHAERQPFHPSIESDGFPSALEGEDLASPPSEVSPKLIMGSALADARRVAEGSGMLQGPSKVGRNQPTEAPAESPIPPISPAEVHAEPTASIDPKHDSPFQVSMDQSHTGNVPVARQVSPTVAHPQPPPSVPSFSPTPVAITPAQEPLAPEPVVFKDPSFDLPEETVIEPEVDVARGPFLTRLRRFSGILRRDLYAQAMFLIDNEGQVLLDEVENPKLIQVARTLANASYRASRQSSGSAAVGNLHVKIGANATLEVIPVQSRYGLLILGVIFPSPIGAERVRQVADLLYTTVEPNDDAYRA